MAMLPDCGKPTRESEVTVVMGRLASNIELAHQEIEQLKQRLLGVRTAKPTCVSAPDNKAPGKLCPLAEQISNQASMVYMLLEAIRTLKDEIEL